MNTKTPKTLLFVSLLLVAAVVLSACGPSQADFNAQQTQIAELNAKLTTPTPSNEELQKQIVDLQTQLSATPSAPVISTPRPTEAPAQPEPADRVARLIELDKVYRAQGWQAWLKAAGVTCDVAVEARQPEEETVTDAQGVVHVIVSGLQVKGNCQVPYPAVVTTDRPGEVTTTAQSRTYQPDLQNPSVMYTDVDLHGQGTIWVDASNWSQMDPTK